MDNSELQALHDQFWRQIYEQQRYTLELNAIQNAENGDLDSVESRIWNANNRNAAFLQQFLFITE